MTQVAGKGMGTAGLAEVLVATYRRQQKKWLRQQGSQPQSVGQLVTALDASRNEVEGLPWASPEACLVLYNLTELRLAHNCLRGDCSAFKPLRRLVHLGAWACHCVLLNACPFETNLTPSPTPMP